MAPLFLLFLSRQPGKTLCIMVAMLHISFRMLVLNMYFIPQSTRQHPNWTYHQALFNESFRTAFYHMTVTKFPLPAITITPGAEQERFILMEP